jgi:hypothetical protein
MMTEYNIEVLDKTEAVIRVTCKCDEALIVSPSPVEEPEPPIIEEPILPPIEPTPLPVEPIPEVPPITMEPISPVTPIPELPVVEEPQTPIIEPIPVPPVVEPIPLPPIVEPVPTPVIPIPLPPVTAPPEACYCDLTSKLNLPDFIKQLTALTKGLLYPSESDFPLEVLTKGFSSKMPPIKGIEVRTIDRVFPEFLRLPDPDDQSSANAERASIADRWQALYTFIKNNCSVTAWHYPIKAKRYTHELILVMLHPQGTVGIRIKLVET